MNRKHLPTLPLLALATLALATLAGCKRDVATAPEVTPAETRPVATAPVAEPAVAAETALDTKAFAGNFSGTLPCADCPGIDTTLELRTDGSFMLMETYQERKGEPGMIEGTWTAEENGSRIRLDPNSKQEQDRLFGVISHDQITALGSDGTPAPTGLDASLKRDAANP